ncbi:TetR/AcrR family transcriptional regulator [Streptomyces sp. NPDC048442]|uniref:TetR/AcrR family transcriptional regulator n=1 Tax=Streptomyces sp. NPDC048442 TaxID=3154823 RepID=UPI0034326260
MTESPHDRSDMGRLTRAEVQELNRRKVLEAAREEFGERGFRDAKIDRIAERAGLTRGAVYSNFPGKRALYFAVLADIAGRTPASAPPASVDTVREALGALARARVARFPLSDDDDQHDNPARDLPSVVLADAQTRQPYAQLLKLDAIVLGLALEGMRRGPGAGQRLVPVAEAVLTLLHGADQLAAAAPGFADPFQVVAACEQLAELSPDGDWAPPHLPYVPKARPGDEAWSPPPATDALRGGAVGLADDGVVAVLGLHRLEAVEEAVRAAAPGGAVTAVLVTGEPGELGPLARLTVAELGAGLRQAFPERAWPHVRLVHDELGVLAAAAGVSAVSDATEAAVRIEGGRVVARAEGRGACYAAATAAPGGRH